MVYNSDGNRLTQLLLGTQSEVDVPAYKIASLVSDLWKTCKKDKKGTVPNPCDASGSSPLKTTMVSTRALYSGRNENEAFILDVQVDRCKDPSTSSFGVHKYKFVLFDGSTEMTVDTRVLPEVKTVQWKSPLLEEIPN